MEQRHYAVMGECLALRTQIAELRQQLATATQAIADQGTRFAAGLKAIKAIAAPLLSGAVNGSTATPKTGSTPPAARKQAARKKAGTK